MTLEIRTAQDLETAARLLTPRVERFVQDGILTVPHLPWLQGLTLLFAGLMSPWRIVFDEKSEAAPELLDLFESTGAPHLQVNFAGLSLDALATLEGREFGFGSSGSTGGAKLIWKSGLGLRREIEELKKLYDLRQGAEIVSLIRPFHIYGFLHSFLLPWATGAKVTYWDMRASLPAENAGFPPAIDLTLLVPAQWRIIPLIWNFAKTDQLVSSGAPFGPLRSQELEDYADRFRNFFEILGSTETGGIGYRRISLADATFRLFPGLKISSEGDATRLHSPFLWPEPSLILSDKLRVVDAQTFEHLGRADRVFKYAGLRFTLGEIEELLSELVDGSPVICAFEEDAKLAQGGRLRAWIEKSESTELRELRTKFAERSSAPFPHRLTFIESFPRDFQGKVALLQLPR